MPERHALVLRGRMYVNGAIQRAAIGIDPDTGLITAIGGRLHGREVYEFGDRVMVPGAIDLHCHFRDPGHPEKEDFASGTLSAIHGGVTAVFDMPNTEPATTDAARWAAKMDHVAAKAHCDFGVYGGVVRPGEATRALAAVAPALKTYLGESTGCVTLEDPASLPDVVEDIAASGFTGIWAFHCEDGPVLAEAHAAHADDEGLPGHEARRPARAETAAYERLAAAVAAYETRHRRKLPYKIHLAHTSTPELARSAIEAGWSWGVTPHHMLLHHGLPLGAQGRVNPPLRSAASAEALHRFFRAGQVPILESDHAPHTAAEKDQPVGRAPSGLPGVETLVPLFMAEVAQRRLPLEHLIQASATGPAQLLGIARGRLEPEHIADVAVYDLSKATRIDPALLHTKATWTPFEGHAACFPSHVFQRGRLVVDDGETMAEPGDGQAITVAHQG